MAASKIFLRACNFFHVVLMFALAIGFAVFEPFNYWGNNGFATGYRIGAGIALGILYFCYWLDFFCFDNTFRFLTNQATGDKAHTYVDNLKRTEPKLYLHGRCYHYQTIIHRDKDSKGNTTTRTERRLVVTYTETRPVPYRTWGDFSGPFAIQNFTSKSFLKLYLHQDFKFADYATEQYFNHFRSIMAADLRWRDQFLDINVNWEIPGYSPNILCRLTEKGPLFFGVFPYLLCSLFMLAFVYRLYVDYLCAEQEYTLYKSISIYPFITGQEKYQLATFNNIPNFNPEVDFKLPPNLDLKAPPQQGYVPSAIPTNAYTVENPEASAPPQNAPQAPYQQGYQQGYGQQGPYPQQQQGYQPYQQPYQQQGPYPPQQGMVYNQAPQAQYYSANNLNQPLLQQ